MTFKMLIFHPIQGYCEHLYIDTCAFVHLDPYDRPEEVELLNQRVESIFNNSNSNTLHLIY